MQGCYTCKKRDNVLDSAITVLVAGRLCNSCVGFDDLAVNYFIGFVGLGEVVLLAELASVGVVHVPHPPGHVTVEVSAPYCGIESGL